jgi:ribosomal protein S27E
VTLTAAKNPACPGCGCQATELVAAGNSAGRPWARYACDACGRAFLVGTGGADKVVEYLEQKIPICPVHGEPMKQNGRARRGNVLYYACKIDGCKQTGKGTQRTVSA